METDLSTVQGVIETFLVRANKSLDGLTGSTTLWGDGLMLDSLEAAELSATLEDTFGTDPFSSAEEMPQTVGDILAFYEVSSSA
ncbi:acyl carrier protein [Marmoricola sp. URHA0025 HA25]